MNSERAISTIGGLLMGFAVTVGIAFACGALVLSPFSGRYGGFGVIVYIIPIAIVFFGLIIASIVTLLTFTLGKIPGVGGGVAIAVITLITMPLIFAVWNQDKTRMDFEKANASRLIEEQNWKRDASRTFVKPKTHFPSLIIEGGVNLMDLASKITLATGTNVVLVYGEINDNLDVVFTRIAPTDCTKHAVLTVADTCVIRTVDRCLTHTDGKCTLKTNEALPKDQKYALKIRYYSSGRVDKYEISEINDGKETDIDSIVRFGFDGGRIYPDLGCKSGQQFEYCLLDAIFDVSLEDKITNMQKQ